MARAFPYRRRPLRPALIVLGVAAVLAVALPDPGGRLAAALVGAGPVWWLAAETLRRQRAVRLTETHAVVEQPLPLFTRAAPFDRIGGVAQTGRPALAYRKPRTAAQVRPRLGLVTFEAVADEEAFWAALLARAPVPLPLSEAQVRSLVRARRARRAMLLAAALLAVPFVVIVLARLAGPLL